MMTRKEAMDSLETWRQGKFIDFPQYRTMSKEWKQEQRAIESLLVRPSPTGNAICRTTSPEDAIWIAERLNLAAKLEREHCPKKGEKA